MAVLAFDDVVLTDLAIPCDVFGRVRDPDRQPLYDVRLRRAARNQVRTSEPEGAVENLQAAAG